jgi:hypothetical protein
MLSKYEALSSNSRTAKKKERKTDRKKETYRFTDGE